MQTAISDALLRRQLGDEAAELGAFVYGAPYPTVSYAANRFLDHAGPLVGLVIVLSFLIPLATMLRALVAEKETKLRESLLMASLSLPVCLQGLQPSRLAPLTHSPR